MRVIQNDIESTVVLETNETDIVLEDNIANGTISTNSLTDEEILEQLEDPIKDIESYKKFTEINIEESEQL